MSELFKNLENKSILITGHVNPDGDALGAALSFKLILDELGFDSDVCFDINGKVPSSLDHLPLNLISQNPKDNYDKLIVFDCGNPQRLGELEILSDTASEVVVVDHHIDPSFGDVRIIDPTAASTTQVLYREITKQNYEISKNIANCLMTGLITDTGRFQYSNTDSEVFNIAAALMDASQPQQVVHCAGHSYSSVRHRPGNIAKRGTKEGKRHAVEGTRRIRSGPGKEKEA